jgi:hypothetical protein
MDKRFSRKHFDENPESMELATDLAKTLEDRLRAADDRLREIDAIVRDLRKVGHDIYSWDEDGEGYSVWGDNYAKAKGENRLLVSFYCETDNPRVEVDFRRWPLDRTKLCAFCGKEMVPTAAVFQVDGHGSVNTPGVQVKIWFGEDRHEEASAGMESYRFQLGGLQCKSCGGTWFPPSNR